jgi:hypothetical protein
MNGEILPRPYASLWRVQGKFYHFTLPLIRMSVFKLAAA